MAITQSTIRNSNGITFTYVVDSSSDWSGVTNNTYFKDLSDGLIYYKNSSGTVLQQFYQFTGGSISSLTATTISAATYQNITVPSGVWGISNSGGTYTYYSTLTLAMSAATTGQTIEMFADVTESSAVTITLKNGVNINGNGHTYTLDTSTTTTGFIDGGTAVTMLFSNITLIRKGAGAGIMIGLSVAGNRIVGNSTFIKIESNSSTGIGTYGGAVFSGYINGFTITCTGTLCAGINLVRGYIDDCNVVSTGSAIVINIGTITNSYGESTGSGNGINAGNTGYIANCHGKSNTGYGINTGVPAYNSNGYSAGSYGIVFTAVPLYNCVGVSAANYGIWGYGEIINNCIAISSAGGALFIQNAQANNCVAYSSVSSAAVMFNSSTINNSTLRTLSGSIVVNTANVTTYSSLKNCSIINDWNNSGGHGVSVNSVLTVLNCSIKVTNTLSNCLNASSAVTMKYANNSFEGSVTPVNSNITQAITNTHDNQGNILI